MLENATVLEAACAMLGTATGQGVQSAGGFCASKCINWGGTYRMERAVARMEQTLLERQSSSGSVGNVCASGRCPATVVLRFRAQAPLSRHATTPSCIAKAGDSRLAGWLTSSVQQ